MSTLAAPRRQRKVSVMTPFEIVEALETVAAELYGPDDIPESIKAGLLRLDHMAGTVTDAASVLAGELARQGSEAVGRVEGGDFWVTVKRRG